MHAMVSTLKHYQLASSTAYVPDSSPFMDDRETMPFFMKKQFPTPLVSIPEMSHVLLMCHVMNYVQTVSFAKTN